MPPHAPQWTVRVAAALFVLGVATGCQITPLDQRAPRSSPSPGATDPVGRLAALTVAKSGSMRGYSRDRFPTWRKTGPNCDVRDSVLKRDGTKVKTSGCNVVAGTWTSMYDGQVLNSPTKVDIDHLVPEIDMPGHVNAAQVAYPELTCDGIAPPPRTDTAVGYSSLCISSPTTYRFVEDVIRELAAMTPGPYIHVGGDEAHATTDADYLTFEQRVLPIVAKYGKTAYGWNEIAKAPAAHTAVAQYWDTATTNPTVAAAAARGTKVVMSPANKAYLDMKYDANTPLGLDWAGFIEVRTAYDWDPGTLVTGVPESAVLGVEAPLWSETLRKLDDIEFMAFPRLAAIAELGWSPVASHDWASFRARLGAYGPRWTLQGVDFYPSPQVDWS